MKSSYSKRKNHHNITNSTFSCLCFGDEAELINQAREHFCSIHSDPRIRIYLHDTNAYSELRSSSSGSLFATAQLFDIVSYGASNERLRNLVSDIAQSANAQQKVIISFYELDYQQTKSAWLKKLQNNCNTFFNAKSLTQNALFLWCKQYLEHKNETLDANIIEDISAAAIGNIAYAKGEIDRQLLLQQALTKTNLQVNVATLIQDEQQFNINNLLRVICSGSTKQAHLILLRLLANNISPLAICASLNRYINHLYTQKNGKASAPSWQQQDINRAIRNSERGNLNLEFLSSIALSTERAYKGLLNSNAKILLTRLVLNLSLIHR